MTGLFQHYKGPLYLVLDTVLDSTNDHLGRSFVIYLSLEKKSLHVRESEEFYGAVTLQDGREVPRFRPIKKLVAA